MEYVPFDAKYPPEWTNMEGKMVLVDQDMGATWKAMEALVAAGKTKTIGICNFALNSSGSFCQQLPSAPRRCRLRFTLTTLRRNLFDLPGSVV